MTRIMIVDDNTVFAMELEEAARELGYQIAGVAATGVEAVQMAKSHHPDLILMDIKMPGEIDGISAARKILHKENIPVIFVTGHVEEALLQRASRVSTDGYIVKPVHPRQLQGAIEVAIRKNNHHQGGSTAESETSVKPETGPSTDENHPIRRLLSPAEYRVAKLLKSGKSSQDIAEKLSLSARTVEWHRMNIRKKLGIFNKKISIFKLRSIINGSNPGSDPKHCKEVYRRIGEKAYLCAKSDSIRQPCPWQSQ